MSFGSEFSFDHVPGKLDDIEVSDQGLAGLGLEQGGFLIAIGPRLNVTRALQDNPLDLVSVRMELDARSTRIRYPDVSGGVRQRVVQVTPRLHFDAADIARVRRDIASQRPDVVVVDGSLSTRDDDLHWAAVIADHFQMPTLVTMATDQGAAAPPPTAPGTVGGSGSVAAEWPLVYAAQPDPFYVQAIMGQAGHQARQPVTRLQLASGIGIPGLFALSTPGVLDVAGISGNPAWNAPSLAEESPIVDQPRHVNTVVWRAGDNAVVAGGEVLDPDRDYVIGIGIGPHRDDSLLTGDASFPDEVLRLGSARRISIFMYATSPAEAETQQGYLYLPKQGPAFTCGVADQLPAATEWTAVDHEACASGHCELAEFAVPRRSGPGEIKLETLIYVGAAAVHKQSISLSVLAGPGAAAVVTYRLLRSFDKLPRLIDRIASIDVGSDHLTVNAIGAPGIFSFSFSDTNWSPATVAVRKTLTDMFFRMKNDKYEARYPNVTVPPDDFRKLLLRLAEAGREMFSMIFNSPDSAALAPLLRNEARVRSEPSVVQIARTLDRPFVVPWQILYDLPMEHPERDLHVCPSVLEYGPGGPDRWPPPVTCPHSDDHAGKSAVLCPWGFWGLAHLIEVPEPPKERSLDHFVSLRPAMAAALVGTGAGLDQKQLVAHLGRLGRKITGFPATPDEAITAAAALGDALEEADTDVVYLLSHAERSGILDLGSALVFSDGRLESKDVAAWTLEHWPPDHWANRRPLIVLNACHTAEITQSTLGGFVTNFVNGGAAGVVGTETLIDQAAASVAMEHFLAAFSAGASVGHAIQLMRWRLLALGSLLGFCYTPYCAASLRLRPTTSESEENG